MCLNKTYSTFHTGKNLSDKFPIQNGLKQDALSLLLFNFVSNTPLRRSKRTRKDLKLYETHQILAYIDDINIVEENTGTMKKNTEALLDAKKAVGLEMIPEETKYMLMSYYQKTEQKHSIKTANRSSEVVAKFYVCKG
jgi:hypothetical protein